MLPKTLINIREDILMVTRKLLSEEGYDKLNMRTIASKCGIATGTLYNYYRSKQQIVEEILRSEWNMMLRRIEQGAKTDVKLIDKLEIIYTELCVLMNNVHNVWFGISNLNVSYNEFSGMKGHKGVLLKSLSDKILDLIRNSAKDRDYEFLSDVMCKMFVIYAYQGDVEFIKLLPVIESLLR